jgi:PAS domain-containing protein
MMRTHAALFAPLDLKSRLFGKVSRGSPRDRLLLMAQPGRSEPAERLARGVRLRGAALDAQPAAQIVVDPAGTVVLANAAARAHFGLSLGDEGRPLQDLTVSYRPVELRSRIEQVAAEGRPVLLRGVEAPAPDGELLRCWPRTAARWASASPSSTSPATTAWRPSCRRPTRSWRRRSRSCSRPTRSWRPRTRSCRAPSRSWRPPTRSSSPPTRSWRP